MRRARLLSGLLAVAACLAGAAPALAQNQLYQDFKGDGVITPCKYSDQQLRNGLRGLPPDIRQYAPGFADQLNAARGVPCGGSGRPAHAQSKRQQAGTPAPASSGGGGGGAASAPQSSVPKPPAPKAKPVSHLAKAPAPDVPVAPGSGGGAPGWLVVLLLGVATFGLVAVLLVRYRGWGLEGLTRGLRASFADAGDRSADAGAELRERMLGR